MSAAWSGLTGRCIVIVAACTGDVSAELIVYLVNILAKLAESVKREVSEPANKECTGD